MYEILTNAVKSCEKIRLSLENCEVEKDVSNFIQERGTGQEIPDPPKYINFCRGDVDDNASAASEDENYSVAQFQRTINPAFRSSSPQPSTYESHHDPGSDLAARMGHLNANTPPSRETTLTPHTAAQKPPPAIDYRKEPQIQAPYQHKVDELPIVPHNEYPTNGMTMFCRTAPPSERSSAASPNRPSSRDSQSEYSNPTSLSSQEPASRKHSPIKGDAEHNGPSGSPAKAVQKKRSGFFSNNSPFRRKSKHEKEAPVIAPAASRGTWGSANNKQAMNSVTTPTRYRGQDRNARDGNSGSPEPVDPCASFQLNVGNNVFDVASPDSKSSKPIRKGMSSPTKQLDPIAAALEELKGVNKQSSVRMSADRYAGVATPGPPSVASMQSSDIAAAQRGTPPPSYHDQPMSRLGAPQPAFTSAQMRQTTNKYVNQNQDIFGSSRPGTRGNASDMPRATSPPPMRSTSPRPTYQGRENQGLPRSASPNPYGGARTRQTPNVSPSKTSYSQHNSPNDVGRIPSPQPQYARQERPNSSGNMTMQLSNGPDGAPRGRVGNSGRPMSFYESQHPPQQGGDSSGGRARSKSVADGRKFTADGRPILQFGKRLLPHTPSLHNFIHNTDLGMS